MLFYSLQIIYMTSNAPNIPIIIILLGSFKFLLSSIIEARIRNNRVVQESSKHNKTHLNLLCQREYLLMYSNFLNRTYLRKRIMGFENHQILFDVIVILITITTKFYAWVFIIILVFIIQVRFFCVKTIHTGFIQFYATSTGQSLYQYR